MSTLFGHAGRPPGFPNDPVGSDTGLLVFVIQRRFRRVLSDDAEEGQSLYRLTANSGLPALNCDDYALTIDWPGLERDRERSA